MGFRVSSSGPGARVDSLQIDPDRLVGCSLQLQLRDMSGVPCKALMISLVGNLCGLG